MSDDLLRAHVRRLLDWQDAHIGFEVAVKDFPRELRGKQVEGLPYSPWQLVEHMRIAQHDILDFCRNPRYVEMKWPDDYWPETAEPPSADAWESALAAFRRVRDLAAQCQESPTAFLIDLPRPTILPFNVGLITFHRPGLPRQLNAAIIDPAVALR